MKEESKRESDLKRILCGAVVMVLILGISASPPVGADERPGEKSESFSIELTKEEREILDQGRISGGRVFGGAVTAATLGFGLGHAVIGTYEKSNAWIYTLVDSVLLGTAALGFMTTITKDRSPSRSCTNQTGGPSTLCDHHDSASVLEIGAMELFGGMALLGLGASHLVQTIHVVSAATSHNSKFKELSAQRSVLESLSLNPMIQNQGGGLQMGLKF